MKILPFGFIFEKHRDLLKQNKYLRIINQFYLNGVF